MRVSRYSNATGIYHTREIPVESAAMKKWEMTPDLKRPLIQDAFPALSSDDREFILTGITPEEWQEIFGDEEE